MTDAAPVEDVAARVEREARSSLFREVARSKRYEVSGDSLEIIHGRDPFEVRDVASGETFLLEVRALPTGG